MDLVSIPVLGFHWMLIIGGPVFSAGDPMDPAFESRRSESRRQNGSGPYVGISFMWKSDSDLTKRFGCQPLLSFEHFLRI